MLPGGREHDRIGARYRGWLRAERGELLAVAEQRDDVAALAFELHELGDPTLGAHAQVGVEARAVHPRHARHRGTGSPWIR